MKTHVYSKLAESIEKRKKKEERSPTQEPYIPKHTYTTIGHLDENLERVKYIYD